MKTRSIPETMRALVVYGKGDYRLETDFPTPECGPDDIIIKCEGCGICAGDVKCYHGAARMWGTGPDDAYVKTPCVAGHEFLGYIVELGENIKGFELGDRVIAEQIVPCDECRFCRSGKYWMCQRHNIFGYQPENNGGFAEYVRFPKTSRVHKVPKELPLRDALLIEPYACSKHAVDRADIGCEDVVVISGAGTLGLGMVSYARMKNPKTLISLDMQDIRLAKALEFGADMAWNPGRDDVVKKIMELTDGYGCDIYIEATGNPASVVQGLNMVRKLGRFVEFSVFGKETTADWSIIGDCKELDLLGAHLSPYCYPFVIENIANGNLKTNGIVSTLLPIEEWERGFELASGANSSGDFKVGLVFEDI